MIGAVAARTGLSGGAPADRPGAAASARFTGARIRLAATTPPATFRNRRREVISIYRSVATNGLSAGCSLPFPM